MKYDVEIKVSNNICASIQVHAESAEEAEDLASEAITLTAKKSYDKTTEREEQSSAVTDEGSLPETTE